MTSNYRSTVHIILLQCFWSWNNYRFVNSCKKKMYGEVPCTLHPVSLIFQNSFGLYYSEICIFLFWKSFSFLKNSSVGKKSACNAGDPGLITGSGRSPGGGHGNPLQYSCLENPIDRGAWWAAFHGVAKSQTQLKWLSLHASGFLASYWGKKG